MPISNNSSFGTQGGLGGLTGIGNQLERGGKIFQTAVGEWSMGIMTLKSVLENSNLKEFSRGALDMSGVMKDLPQIFTKSKIVDTIASLSDSIYFASKTFQKEYGKFGDTNKAFLSGIINVTKQTQLYGISITDNLEMFGALANELRSLNVGDDWVKQASLISEAFDIGKDSTAKMASMFKFQKQSPEDFYNFMEKANTAASELSIPVDLIAQSIANSSTAMQRFNIATAKGTKNLLEMAKYSAKMGIDIDTIATSLDGFRSFEGAAQGAMQFGLAGMNVNAMQLMSMARSGNNPQDMMKQVLNHIENYAGKNGNMQGTIAVDLADKLGPMIGMNREEIQKAIYRSRMDSGKVIDPNQKDILDRLKAQQNIMASIDNVLKSILLIASPVFTGITNVANFLSEHTTVLKTIAYIVGALLTASLAFHVFMKIAMASKMWKATAADTFNWGYYSQAAKTPGGKIGFGERLQRMWSGTQNYGIGNPDPVGSGVADAAGDVEHGGGRRARKQNRPIDSGGRDPGGVERMKAIHGWKNTMAGAVGTAVKMIAFAGAFWILAKAMKEFAGVSWKQFGIATASLVAFSGAWWAMSKTTFSEANIKNNSIAIATIVGLSAAVWGLGKALQLYKGVDLASIGSGMAMLALGVASIALLGVGATAFGGIGILGLGVGLGLVATAIISIGAAAEKYAKPIETLSYAMERLANAMMILTDISIKPLDIKIDSSTMKALESVSLAYNGSMGSSSNSPVQVHTHVYLDKREIAEAVGEFWGKKN